MRRAIGRIELLIGDSVLHPARFRFALKVERLSKLLVMTQ
jgi:hypothetical protein